MRLKYLNNALNFVLTFYKKFKNERYILTDILPFLQGVVILQNTMFIISFDTSSESKIFQM